VVDGDEPEIDIYLRGSVSPDVGSDPEPLDSDRAPWGGQVVVPIPERDQRKGRWDVHPPTQMKVYTPGAVLRA
jgi:hypothetical protein